MPSINITPAEVRNLRAVLQHGAVPPPAAPPIAPVAPAAAPRAAKRKGKISRPLYQALYTNHMPIAATTTTTTAPKAKRAKA